MSNKSNIDQLTGRNKFVQRLINIVPKGIRLRMNPRRYAIETFVNNSARKTKSGSLILDAGAGPCPYKKLFNHCKYEATDFVKLNENIDFVCKLDNIPRPSGYYNVVLCTEVIEHVEYPDKVITEMYRVLKKGGKLFLTCPQSWMVHQAPYNYYYFVYYGLESLVKNAGFKKYKITPMGGYYWFLADVIRFNNILEQIRRFPIIYYPLRLIDVLVNQMVIPFLLFHLDWIDKKKDWTMGYSWFS
jgi:SAM-dependent methyltransferase